MFEKVLVNSSHKILNLTDFMKLCVRLVDLELHFRNTFVKCKNILCINVDLDEWNKLSIYDFSSWGRLEFRKRACRCENLKFQNLSGPNSLR